MELGEQFRVLSTRFADTAYGHGGPIVCDLHEIFGTDGSDHNCLGCNLAESINVLGNFLECYSTKAKEATDVHICYTTYLVLAYLMVERMDTIFNIIELNAHYRKEKFKVLTTIRKWANFVKHPKAFVLTHHASYTFEGSPDCIDLRKGASVVIDRSFVDKYYSNDEKNKELYEKLENKENIVVIFPNAEELNERLCVAFRDLVEMFRENSVYREVIADRSTYRDYWQDG